MDGDARNADALFLGIDVGTSSVKAVLVDRQGRLVCCDSKPSDAHIDSDIGGTGDEQSPCKILEAVTALVLPLIKPHLHKIAGIGVSGQMHGVLLWSDQPNANSNGSGDAGATGLDKGCTTSSLYTWQDQRCGPAFLASLPTPSGPALSTGHGLPTMLWLEHHRPGFTSRFSHCGTIMDYLTHRLCGMTRPVTSDQLAASMGYFNTNAMAWDKTQLESAGFLMSLLPDVVRSGAVIGHVCADLEGWPCNVPVLCAMGDCQCAMRVVLQDSHDAAINLSTSVQLAFSVSPDRLSGIRLESPPCVSFFPYFNGHHLALCAGLNGGNVIQHFVQSLGHWMQQLGMSGDLSTPALFKKLDTLARESSAEDQRESSPTNPPLLFTPTFYGERHDTALRGSLTGLTPSSLWDLGGVYRALCQGVLDHLHSMVSGVYLRAQGVKRLLVTGSVVGTNAIVRERLIQLYQERDGLEVRLGDSNQEAVGSALGAALVAGNIS